MLILEHRYEIAEEFRGMSSEEFEEMEEELGWHLLVRVRRVENVNESE